LLEACGHEVIVANPRQLSFLSKNDRKSDRVDPELLARLGRTEPKLLYPLEHRGEAAQADLAIIRSRDALVSARSQLVNHVRGAVKATGARLPQCSTESFHQKVVAYIPTELSLALSPLLQMIESMTQQLREYDELVEQQCQQKYPGTELLRQVVGVGPLTALAYILTLEDPHRFQCSRSVGGFLGLSPKQRDSGEQEPQLRITKAGDLLLRRLLVGSAHYILGPFGPDTDLRRWGLKLAERGGKNAKKRAVVAVARKLAVLLHRLWINGEVYEPLYNAQRKQSSQPVCAGANKE
jgi:transposase